MLLGEGEKVLANLERAYKEHDWDLKFLKVAPIFSEYRSDPQFQDPMKKMRLD